MDLGLNGQIVSLAEKVLKTKLLFTEIGPPNLQIAQAKKVKAILSK